MSPCESNFELKSACVSSLGVAKSAWLSNFGEKFHRAQLLQRRHPQYLHQKTKAKH